MEEQIPDDSAPSAIFRPSKRRKIIRKRPLDAEDEPSPQQHAPPADAALSPKDGESDAEPDATSVAEILRLRKAKQRRGGIETGQQAVRLGEQTSKALVAHNNDIAVVDITAQRFAPQTGLVKDDLDQHMMAYVDSKMAEIRSQAFNIAAIPSRAVTDDHTASNSGADLTRPRQAVGAGKLMEIDLGPDTTLRNIERTEKATRRLLGDDEGAQEQDTGRATSRRKPRLGPDGKPWRGGRRNRRTSEDMKRDKLVEQLLREHRLDLYPPEADGPPKGAMEDDEGADERLAEQFRQEYLDSQLAKRKTTAAPPARPGEEKPKGPKLGGSRAARAAMQKALEEASKKKKK